jgi:putative two-component system response regulator
VADSGNSKRTILVADDEIANCDLLEGLLGGAGYDVVCVQDGLRALRAVRESRIDLVLLDVMMPGKTGFSACVSLKSQPETRLIPVVMVTGLTGTDDRVHGAMCGADDFLSKPVNKQELLARVQSLLRIKEFTDELENSENVLFSLALTIEAKDHYTEGHCDRLARYSVALGGRLKLSEEMKEALRRAGIVHDIGKVTVPEHILLKPGPLTDEEWAVMKQHPVVGERICSPLKSFRMALPGIRHHHEKRDGSGYPDGLKGDDIPLIARILQTVDVYDALTTDRPYRKALPHEKVFSIMREEVRRGWWDGSLLDELELLIRESARHLAGVGANHEA